MLEIISCFAQQVFSVVGIIAIFGLLCALSRKIFVSLLGNVGWFIINYVTGIIGTPIHELSHAFFNVIFGHKITKIDLYSPNDGDDALGYVAFNYNDKNIYHLIGLFFSGIGPIIGGSAVIILLMYFLVPDLYYTLSMDLEVISTSTNFIEGYIEIFSSTIPNLFDSVNLSNFWFWLFLILSLMIASHMELSLADIQNASKGLIVLLVALLVIDIILYIVDSSILLSITDGFSYFGMYLSRVLFIGGLFNIFLVLIAIVIRVIDRIIRI